MVEKSFLPNVKDIDVPTLIVQNSNDPWTDMGFVDSFYNQLTVEKEIHWADLAKNRIAAYDYIGQNPEGVYEWYDRYI
jgi:esterase/lipase